MSAATVATQVTGCVDAVADGDTGTLVPPRDPLALARAIQAYLASPALRAAHGAAGRRRVERMFDGRLVRRAQLAFYDEILRRYGLPGLHFQEATDPPSPLRQVSQ